ncbi:MAG TPA: hypothetical protein VEB65_11485 [Solirubrobacterales bacterium]|nr:hypothetical protein [Solirubrobacterales bacterium]
MSWLSFGPLRRPRLSFGLDSGPKDNRVGRALRQAPVPVDLEAERRGLEVVLAAYGERRPRARRTSLPRLALAFAAAALLAALVLSPAGASVRDWVDDVFSAAPPPSPRPGLGEIPGGGRLLVQGRDGPWVVAPDGSRHRLGDYDEASWSPHGLFVAATAGRELSAVAPDGEAHWTLSAPGAVRDPRWAPSGELIAFRAGAGLRVVAGDGSEARPLDESVAPLAPSWSPLGGPQLAYVDARGALRVLDVARDRALGRAATLPEIRWLEWGGRGDVLMEASRRRIRLRPVVVGAKAGTVALGRPRAFNLPAGETVEDVALSPSGERVAALLGGRFGGVRRSELIVFDSRHRAPLRLLGVPGRLAELAWAPGGGRLLVGWPRFDEWLFLPARVAVGEAVTGVSQAFAPAGERGRFPRVEGWCCRAGAPDG